MLVSLGLELVICDAVHDILDVLIVAGCCLFCGHLVICYGLDDVAPSGHFVFLSLKPLNTNYSHSDAAVNNYFQDY